jgi:outer membrane protein assembly factor BamB
MKFNRLFFFLSAALLSVFLSACGGPPPAANWPGMTSDGKNIYITDVQFIYIVQASNGQAVMIPGPDGVAKPLRFPADSDASVNFYAAPLLTADGQMILGNGMVGNPDAGPRLLYSVDPTAGTPKWTFAESKGVWLGSAVSSGDSIYAASGNGKVYALDLKGKKRWEAAISSHALWSAPVTDGKLVYISTLDHQIIALNAQSGAQAWKTDLETTLIASPIVTADGTLYVGTLSGNLYALKTSDGSKVWQAALDGNIWSTPVVDGDKLYIGTSKGALGKLYALNVADGKTVWTHDEARAIVASPLVLPDQIIYVTEAGHIQSLNKDNSPKWQVDIQGAKIYTAPILVGDQIVIAPMQAQFILAAYDQNGLQKWTFAPAK